MTSEATSEATDASTKYVWKYVWEDVSYWCDAQDRDRRFCKCSGPSLEYAESIHTKRQDNVLHSQLLTRVRDTDVMLSDILAKYDPTIVADISIDGYDDKHDRYLYYMNHCRQETIHTDYFQFCLFSDILFHIFEMGMEFTHYADLLTEYIQNTYCYDPEKPYQNETCSFLHSYTYLQFINRCFPDFGKVCVGSSFGKPKYVTRASLSTFDGFPQVINSINFIVKCGLIDMKCLNLRQKFNFMINKIDEVTDQEYVVKCRLLEVRSALTNAIGE